MAKTSDIRLSDLGECFGDDKKPSPKNRDHYLNIWKTAPWLAEYPLQEGVLDAFFKEHSINTTSDKSEKEWVKAKCRLLDNYYHTNLKEGLDDAVNDICNKDIDFDGRISSTSQENVVKLVEDISKVQSNKSESKEAISFASKYCSHYNDKGFPIYDKYVRSMLCLINRKRPFLNGKSLRKKTMNGEYGAFYSAMNAFCSCTDFWGDKGIDFKTADRYLWTWAKEILHEKKLKAKKPS
jgi:hypothetical protein